MLRLSLVVLGGARGRTMKRPVIKNPRGKKKRTASASAAAKKRAVASKADAAASAEEEASTSVVPVGGSGAGGAPPVLDVSPHKGYAAYRLATAVSTVIVPPAANEVLEGMKQIITPAHAPSGAASATMEEYYTSRKGPLFATAVIAGTHAVKQASTLVPFCHPVPIHKCSFTFRRRVLPRATLSPGGLPHRVVLRKRTSPPSPLPSKPECSIIYCFCTVATDENKGGVELEALTGATVAGITLYDMLKGLPGAQEDGLSIGESFILAKRGGRSDFIKLLMSEPDTVKDMDKPLIGGPAAGAAKSAAASAAAASAEAEGEGEGQEEEEEEAEDEEPAAKPVVRNAPGGGGGDNHNEMEGAWWRSSKKEKRLQEKFPRRKYGDGARVSPEPDLRPKGAKKKAGDEAEEEPEEEEEEEETAPVKKQQKKSAAAALVKTKRVTAKSRAALEAEAEEEEEEEPEPPVKRGRGSEKTKTTASQKKPSAEYDEEIEEEEETPPPPAKKGRNTKGKAKQTVEEEEEEEPEEEVADDDEEEEVAVALTKKGKGKGKGKGADMKPVKHDSWDDVTTKARADEEEPEEGEEEAEEEDEEEAPPPPPKAKKLLKKKAGGKRSKK